MLESTVSVTFMVMSAVLLSAAICNVLLFPINKFKGVCSVMLLLGVMQTCDNFGGLANLRQLWGYANSRQF